MAWSDGHLLAAPGVGPDGMRVVLGLWLCLDVIEAVDLAVADEGLRQSVLFRCVVSCLVDNSPREIQDGWEY